MRKFNSVIKQVGPLGSVRKPNIAAAGTYSISIVSTSAGANAIPSNNYANEGNNLQININTYNITYQLIYWSITGTTTSADLNGAALTGTSSVGSLTGDTLISGLSRRRQLNFTIKLDGIADGTKTLGFIARTGSQSGPIVASYENINVYDISTTPIYSISMTTQSSPGSASVSEGQSPYTNYIQFAITTAGVADNTSLYWNIDGLNITPADFTSPGETALNGSCMINSNAGIVYFYTAEDYLTEGTEGFTFYLRTDSIYGTIVAQRQTDGILDTSLTAVAPPSGGTTYILSNGPGKALNPTFSPSTVNFGIDVALSPPATIGPTFTFDTGQYGYGVDLGPGIPGIYTVTTQSAMTAQINPYYFSYSGLTSSLPIRTGPSTSVSPRITYSAPAAVGVGGQFDSPGPLGQGMMSPGDFWFADNTVAQQIVTAFKTGVHFYVWGEPWNQTVGEYVVGPSDAFLHHPGSRNVYISFNYVGPPAVAQNFMTHANGYYIETVASGGGSGPTVPGDGGTVANLATSGNDGTYLYIQFFESTDATAFVNWGGSGTIIITAGDGGKMSYTGVSAILAPDAPPGYVRITYSGTPSPAGLGSPGIYATVTY